MLTIDINFFDDWKEGDHPRGQPKNAGQFGKKGAGKTSVATPASTAKKVIEAPKPASARSGASSKPMTKKSEFVPTERQKQVVLERATKNKGMHEADYHKKSFQYADKAMLTAISNTIRLKNVHNDSNGLGFYRGGATHEITMPTGETADSEQTIWRHEFGHAMDYNGYQKPASEVAEPERQDEAKILLANMRSDQSPSEAPSGMIARKRWLAEKLSDKGLSPEEVLSHAGGSPFRAEAIANVVSGANFQVENMMKMARAKNDDGLVQANRPEETMMMDFCGAMTNNEFGYGHTNEYYEKIPHRRTAEMFANYVALTAGPGGKIYRTILHVIAPKCCSKFDEIISSVGNDGS